VAYITDENGEYKRTVRCGHCWEKGHNKSSCPERKKDLANRIKTVKAQIKADSYENDWSRNSDQQRLESYTEQLDRMLNKGKNRKCSYCSQGGHNRKTCAERKEEITKAASDLTTWRERLHSKMQDVGLGVGAIVRTRVRTQDDTVSALGFVEDIYWNNLDNDSIFVKEDWRPSCPNIVKIRVLGDYVNRWNEKVASQQNTVPFEVANIDNDVFDEDKMRRIESGYPALEMVSGVDEVVAPKNFLDPDIINNLAKRYIDGRR